MKTTVRYKKVFRPLKDLKGSSVWKGSGGGSLTLLLLNMAIFDLKVSSWKMHPNKQENNQCQESLHNTSLSLHYLGNTESGAAQVLPVLCSWSSFTLYFFYLHQSLKDSLWVQGCCWWIRSSPHFWNLHSPSQQARHLSRAGCCSFLRWCRSARCCTVRWS